MKRTDTWYVVSAKDFDPDRRVVLGEAFLFLVGSDRAHLDKRTELEIINAAADAGYEVSYLGSMGEYYLRQSARDTIHRMVMQALKGLKPVLKEERQINITIESRLIKYE